MKQSVGTTYMLNFIIVFIVVVFALLSATLSYMKAFKVNSRIALTIEKYEGYNSLSVKEIDKYMASLGYNMGSVNCKEKTHKGKSYKNENLKNSKSAYDYCIYAFDNTGNYYSYGILTYIYINIPIASNFLKVPVYSETEKIYDFSS